jgi:Phage integrase family
MTRRVPPPQISPAPWPAPFPTNPAQEGTQRCPVAVRCHLGVGGRSCVPLRTLPQRHARSSAPDQPTTAADSERIITIDEGTADVLKAWRKVQLGERLAWAGVWTDTGRVFTREDGTPLRPGAVSEHFAAVVARLGLPPVRFHDLRHGAATMLLAAGQPPKVISETLGHSTVAFTMDVYTEVAGELAEAAAVAIAAFIPRRAKTVPNGGRMITDTKAGTSPVG